MGYDDESVAITEESLVRIARDKGYSAVQDQDCNGWIVSDGKEEVFLPSALTNGGYTQGQLDAIEDVFASTEIRLFPLNEAFH